MTARILNVLRSITDPLRNPNAAARWIAAMSWTDSAAVQKKILDLVTRFPTTGREIGPARVEALLKVDARLEPVLAEMTLRYTADYQKSTEIEVRAWHLVFDLVKAFSAAYQAALRAGYPKAEDKRWRAILPWVLVRLAYYRGLDGKFRLFRFSHWIPSQWRDFHELYEFARTREWHREQLVFGAGTFSRPGVCVEQEYLKTLLLMRLDSGNFTADQVEWVARQLEDWAPSLILMPPPGANASFYVDLTGSQGLSRHDRPHTGGRLLFLDAAPVYTRVVERMRWLPEHEEALAPGELPAREQRLLLVRLAALYGPDTLAITPRAARHEIDSEVRVVIGLRGICSAITENEVPPDGSQPAGSAIDGVTLIAATAADGGMPVQEVAGSMWRMADTSATGCRLTAQVKDGVVRLGELLAIKDGESWALAVVRRMQRDEIEGLTLGVEIIAKRFVRVVLRGWSAGTGAAPGSDRPYFALYLPTNTENRRAQQRSLIGPSDRLVAGTMVELHTGNARYLIRFTQALEHQNGWSWALFSAVRKLAA